MSKEKIYFEEGDVSVTSSRVLIGEVNHILRNIEFTRVTYEPSQATTFYVGGVVALAFGIGCWLNPSGINYMGIFAIVFLVTAGITFYMGVLQKKEYGVTIKSVGNWSNILESETDELPTKVVDAINSALLDLDKLGESEKSDEKSDDSSEELSKYKKMFDDGIITQEEYDAKRKQILGL